MKKILFITNRNIVNSDGEMRLIKNRAKAMYESFGISTDYISMIDKRKLLISQENIGHNTYYKIVSYNKYNPLSVFFAKLRLKRELKNIKEDYVSIITSGFFVISFIKFLRKRFLNTKIINDIHGTIEELKEYPRGNIFLKIIFRYLYKRGKKNEKKFLNKYDGILVVSEALRNRLIKEYNLKTNIFIVPCSLENNEINIQEKDSGRRIYRDKYLIKENELLFIYSGGTSSWQCFDLMIDIYAKIRENIKFPSKLLILTPPISNLQKRNCNFIIYDSYSSIELTSVLYAGDYCFMIRENTVTNNVSFPNKFLEYVKSGMFIISTPFISDISSIIYNNNLGELINISDEEQLKKDLSSLVNKINNEHVIKPSFDTRKGILHKYSFDNSLKLFISFIDDDLIR